ncbi:MAG: polymer-forming cytoskeletal protein, partial [Desulfobacteraceae bacterium]
MRKNLKERKVNTHLGSGTSFNGSLEFNGTVRLDGNVTGNILSQTGTVVIEKNALVKADILVKVALISGEVIGTVKAVEKIELYPSARINGDLIS